MRVHSNRQLGWLVKVFVLVLMASDSAQVLFEDYVDEDNINFLQAMVEQHTLVYRRRRSVFGSDEEASFTHWYDFPEKMTFTVTTGQHLLTLNLTRNQYAHSEVTMTDETGKLEIDYKSRFGVYYSVEQGASVLVECEMDTCFLYGTLTIGGDLLHIEQDHSSTDLSFHTLRSKLTPDMNKMTKSMAAIPPGESTSVGPALIRKRRSTSAIPDCDIIEVKILLDNTIWDYYVDKHGANEALATEEIWKYFTSLFAEVDYRLNCLTDDFTHYSQKHGTCDVKCLRVILVDIMITKTSSWTEGNFLSGTSFVKGNDGLVDCGNINFNQAGSATGWHHFMCFTRLNIVLNDGSWRDLYRSAVYSKSICNSDIKKRVSVHEAKGDAVDIQIVHSLLKALNAPDDRKTSCGSNGFFIMREPQSTKPTNPGHYGAEWYTSNCTIGPICTYVNGLSTNCMRVLGHVNETIWREWETTPLPGEVFSTDEQCKVRWGNDSVQCDPTGGGDLFPDDLCSKYMYCTKEGECICKVRVSSGTPCSPCAKICLKGQCMLIPDVPLGDNCECHSQCAGNNTVCEPGPDDCGVCACKDGFYRDGSVCIPKVPNGGGCDDDSQCLDENAICVNSTCQCRPCYYDNSGTCEEQFCLGGNCSSTEQCKGDHVVCDPTRDICVCEEGYFVDQDGNCVRLNGSLCVPCTNGSCTQTDTECGDDGFCVCVSGTVEVDGECYGTRVGDRCTNVVDTCIDDNAGCNGTVCVCDAGFTWNGTLCVGGELCDPCDSTCNGDLVCSPETYRCACPTDEVQVGDDCYGRRVTDPCTSVLDTCIDDNAMCNGTVCTCIQGFTWNGTICVGEEICDPCDPTDSTCLPHLVCNPSTYRCACPTDQVQIEDECYGTRVTEDCTTSLDTCIDDNAECIGNVCDCILVFVWNGSICVGSDLCDPCDSNTLSCDTGLVCSPDTHRCECPVVQIGDECYGTRVTEPCTPQLDTCIDDNADCNGTICDCVSGYVWNGTICVGSNLCDPCDPSTTSCNSPLVCGAQTNTCECPPGYVQIGNDCYGTRVTDDCTQLVDTCIDDNAECNGTVCNCISGFTWNGSICVGPDLCDPCDPSTPSCDDSLVCNPDTYRCECPTDQVQIGDACYGTLIGEPCTTDLNTCTDDNAVCNGTVCDCKSGFTWNGTVCVGTYLCDPCDPSTPSCDDSLVCNPETYRCECPTDQVQIGDACYGTRVTEVCSTLLDTCVDDYAQCNGTICDCIPEFHWNGSICVGQDLCNPCDSESDSCSSDLVCSQETSRCECPSDQVQIGDDCYGTRVTERCLQSLDTCVDNWAVCNGTICVCVEGFTWTGTVCVGSTLCDTCDPYNSTCSPPLVCNMDTETCECPTGEVQIGNTCYGTKVTERCTNTVDTCTDQNAECNGTICDCITGFTWNGTICVGPDLCDPCDSNSCDSSLVCSSDTYRCECPAGFVQIGDNCYGTLVTQPCSPDVDTCIDLNADCNGTVCDCVTGFTWNGSDCLGQNLCDPCDPSTPSCDHSLVCNPSTYRCECPTDQVQIGNACYGTRISDSCTSLLDTCIDHNAACNGTVCDCQDGFTWNGSVCVGSDLCDPCDPSPLSCDAGLVCSLETYRCECPPNQVQIGSQCYGTRVTEPCTNTLDTCVDDNAGCNGTVCDCNAYFTWNGTICVGSNLCDPCDPLTPSCDPGSLVCSPNTYRCECPDDQVQIGDECYGTRVTEACTTVVDTCIDLNAECNGTICDCISGFSWNGALCVGSELCELCDTSNNTCIAELVCSPDTNRCECPPDRVQIGNGCYGTLVTEPCSSTVDTCVDDRAMCNGTVCDCMADYTWNGSICVGTELCHPCDSDTAPCSNPLVCSPDTDRCECPPDQVQVENACYGTRVTESCTTTVDTCIDNNADCLGNTCSCIPGFSWNGTLCVGSGLCDPCDNSTLHCDTGRVCSPYTNRCECPTDQVQIGDECVGTRIGDPCSDQLNTCIDDRATCNGTICDCMSGYTWNGTICVGDGLCEPCDEDVLPCGNGYVCSSDTNRCECPTNQVQIGDGCYGTRVNEECSDITDTCTDDGAECNGTICICRPGLTWDGSECVGTDIDDPCGNNSCSGELICHANTSLCVCPPDTVRIGDSCYGTRIDENCIESVSTCIDDNAGCVDGLCSCLSEFVWNGSICVGPDLCDPCDPDTPSCDDEYVCSTETYRCECPTGYVQIGDDCYGTLVTQPCTNDLDTCVDHNAGCNGTICDCLSGFVWNGSICVGQTLCDPCDSSTLSCDTGLVCSPDTYRCECPSYQVQIGDECFGTRVTEACTNVLSTCIDDNAGCNGTECDCLEGYSWNGSICVGSENCDPCDPSVRLCGAPLVCGANTYRCECPPDRVQIGASCYGTRVNESCTPAHDTCIDDNAQCIINVCNCKPDFTWNGTICVGSAICDTCDSSVLSCDSPLVCSPATYRCECPADQVQIGDNCYGTLVTEECTTALDTCKDDNAECNGTVCDCISGFSWNGSICVGQHLCDPCDSSTLSCDADLVCSTDTYKCECPPDYVQIGNNCYGTRVTEICTNQVDTCVDNNAVCNGTICVCKPGFVWTGTLCVAGNLCDACDPSTPSCHHSFVCNSDTNRCECPSDRVQVGDECYGTHVTEPCTSNPDTCTDSNANCNGTVCDCISGFAWNGSLCVGSGLCDPCDDSTLSCDTGLGLVCSSDTNKCECPTGQVQIGDHCYGTRVTDLCTTVLDTCVDHYAECNGTVCDCETGFTWNGTICVGEDLCHPCDPEDSTCASPLVCSADTSRCECPANFVQIGNNCYGTQVGEPCTNSLNTCVDQNAACNGTVCDCVDGFVWNGSLCVGAELCDPCDPSDSTCGSDLVCSSDTHRCECPSHEVQIGNECYGRLVSERCLSTLDTCIDHNADCNGTICDCVSEFIWNGSICVGSKLCDPCDSSTLSCESELVCSSDTYVCECPPGQVQIGDFCSGRLVTEACTTTVDVCIDDRAWCNGTECDCLPGNVWNGSICVGQDLCDPCDPSISSCTSSLVCNPQTYRCECRSDHVQIGSSCYGTKVTELCTTSLDTCVDLNAGCNGTVCDCDTGFTWNGSICVGPDLCDPCDPSQPSCDSSLVCSPSTYRCECPADQVQIGNACYGTRVTEPCTTPDTCADEYAECNGTVCDCKEGFTWNGTICVGQSLCDPCNPPASTCTSPLVCGSDTSRCECPSGFVQIGDSCYGKHVTAQCSPSVDTCIDDNAACNGTVCDCLQDFVWNGSICVGSDLCDPCDPSISSCGSDLVCNPVTYKCECPTDQVRIGDGCYGTLVTEPCTTALDTCFDLNAACNGTVCTCISEFVWNGTVCVGPDLCDPCDPSTSSCGSDLVCSAATYRCECQTNQVQIGNACYGTLVTEFCTTSLDTCTDYNAACNGTMCDCVSGYTWNGSICVGSELCAPCDSSTLACNSPLVCDSSSGRCECPADKVQIGDACYGRFIGDNCTSTLSTCIDDNAQCSGSPGVCQCISPFSWNVDVGLCVGPNLDDPCDSDSCGSGLSCSATSQRCECHTPPLQIDNECYGTRVGESCTTMHDTCIDDYAECSNGTCSCEMGFTWNGLICVGTELDDPCDSSNVSCASNGLVCGSTNRCECPADQVQVDDTCLSLICGPCFQNSDCAGTNQVCTNGSCQCDTNFFLDNSSVCQPKKADNQSCESDEQCVSNFCICGMCEASDDDDCCQDCDEIQADIVFITDNSGSVGESNYELEIAFLLTLISRFTVSQTDARIGVVDYSTQIIESNSFNMDVYNNNLDITATVSGHTYTGGFTRTDLAVIRATEYFNTGANRPNVPNFVIVITDGNTNNGGQGTPLQNAVTALKAVPDMTVFTVGVGDNVDVSELQLIASSNDNVFQSTGFESLNQIEMALLDAICSSS